jgi:type VI secretion system protein ImpF
MAEELVHQSVFDRLIGADRVEELVLPEAPPAESSRTGKKPAKPRPAIHRRLPRTWEESVEILKRNVLRDLELLLNARQISNPAASPFDQLERSAYNYGLRDLSSYSADSADTPGELQRMIERAIGLFEPRIQDPRVKLVAGATPQSSKISFLISGTLRADPDPERIEFDTVLEVSSKRFEVSNRGSDVG